MNRIDRFILDCPSWKEFRARIEPLTQKEKGDLFERVAQLHLKTEPEYQAILTDVWLLREVDAQTRAEIGLPRNDKGIDLIARCRDGRYWAIQAKYRTNEDHALGWDDLSTAFGLASAPRRNISQFVVIHTTARPIGNRELMGAGLIEIGLDQLQNADWLMIHRAIIENAPVRPTPRTPTGQFAWQQPVIDKAVEHFVAGGATRGRMQLPCGTGKSLIAYYVANALNANLVIVAVPSLALVRQSVHDVWLREEVARERMTDWLCVASDDTVGQVDEIADETVDIGLPTTTDAAEIAEWLRSPSERKIVFTTYQSSARLAEAARQVNVEFDLIVLDEAHRTAGARDREFVTLLHNDKIKARRRLFMTATERKINGDDVVAFSMDDNAADYGARFYTMSFKEAIERDIITDYQIVTYVVTDKEVEELIKANRLLNAGPGQEAVDARDVAAAVAVKRVIEEYGVRHPLVFARSITASKSARDRQDLLNTISFGPFAKNFHVDSTMSAAEREQQLDEFIETSPSTIFNARCLTEGVDLPGIDSVIFTAPKQSVVDIVQAAGRALRKAPGKTQGYIIIPIIVPEGMTFETFAETTEYRKIVKIVSALSTQDERIVEELKAKFYGPTVQGGKRRERVIKIGGHLPIGFNISLEEFAESIDTRAWQSVARQNWLPFEEARAFARKLGLKSGGDWRAYSKSAERPANIPTHPYEAYAEKGWTNWGDWLGTGNVQNGTIPLLPFEEARAFVRDLGFKDASEWRAYSKSGERPANIPSNPNEAYAKEGWTNFGDWLGTGNARTKTFLPFEEARAFAQKLGLKVQTEWQAYSKSNERPANIPADPSTAYANKGWTNWGDWLGTGNVAYGTVSFLPFEEARAFAHKLGFKGQTEWRAYSKSGKKPDYIPRSPYSVYAEKGWTNWGDWLGTSCLSFEEARAFAHKLGLKSQKEWLVYRKSGKRPSNIPTNPNRTYAGKGWTSWGDWLGTGTKTTTSDKRLDGSQQAA
jgi:superfamily II DNA or RNA helicase